MDGPKGFDPAIADFYERTSEEARLEQGPFQLEEARTRDLIQRFERRSRLTERPLASCRVGDARALDIPGGAADIVLLLLGSSAHLLAVAQRQAEG